MLERTGRTNLIKSDLSKIQNCIFSSALTKGYLHGLCPRYALWETNNGPKCQGKFVHGVCIFSRGDIKRFLIKSQDNPNATDCLMINKFGLDVDPQAAIEQFYRVYSMSRTKRK